jgi:hypothetical protein
MRGAAFVLEQRVWIIFWQVEHISQKREAGRRFRMQGVPSGIRTRVVGLKVRPGGITARDTK